MKLTQIALNRSAYGLFLKDRDTIKISNEHDRGLVLEHNKKKLGWLTHKLMSKGRGVHYYSSGNEVQFKPCKKMEKLAKDLKDMEECKTKYARMRLIGVIRG